MKKLIIICLLSIAMPVTVFSSPSNPWADRYTNDSTILPAELPAVRDAISSAREHTGIESNISYNEVESKIANILQDEGAGENILAKIKKRNKNGLIISYNSELTYEISDLTYNARDLLWNATLYPYDSKKTLAPIKLMGNYDEMVKVPVLNRRIRRDEIITISDIKWQEIAASRLRNDAAMTLEQIIGQTPRRTISPNRSVRLAELTKPSVIHKNDHVTLQFRSGIMEIRTIGEAMEEGAAGDIIRIRNKDSNQPVQARVLASGLAEVMPLGILAQAGENY